MDKLCFNGVSGVTGEYLSPEMTFEQVAQVARGEPLDEQVLLELKTRVEIAEEISLGAREGIDATDLAAAGWGVVFASSDGEADAKREKLKPLLDLREEQAGGLYKELVYEAGHSARRFLARHGATPVDPAEPHKVPYYLLLVGSPESIPYRFQYQLDVVYAVGRIHFDSLEEYAGYAAGVVAAERGGAGRSKSAMFFGVRNTADRATQLSADKLVEPLAAALAADRPEWAISTRIKGEATKEGLTEIIESDDGPALLFTASHGMAFPNGHARQAKHQGALLCQNWDGPGNVPDAQKDYFSADDVKESARLAGLVTFHFACYGAGTPKLDDFAHRAGERLDIAPEPFVASLPQKLLAGGGLVTVGHIERAWGYSFVAPGAGPQIGVFESCLERLMKGHPVGSAMELFDDRYAALSTELAAALEDIEFGAVPNDRELAFLWTANNDARSYVIVGDPAVRLAVE